MQNLIRGMKYSTDKLEKRHSALFKAGFLLLNSAGKCIFLYGGGA